MKNTYKITIIAFLSLSIFLVANCAKASIQYYEDFGVNLNNEKFSLVKTENKPTVYLIVNNKRHKILSAEIFIDYGFNWNDIKIISTQELEKYPKAKVVKTAENPSVYYIDYNFNQKKFIYTGNIFLAYGNRWEDIITISQKDLESYSNARVIKGSGPTVYKLENGIKKAISGPTEFLTNGYRWGEIIKVKDLEIDYYATTIIVNGEEVTVAGVEYEENEYEEEYFDDEIILENSYLSIKTITKDKEEIIPSGSIVSMLKLQLTAGIERPVSISALKIGRAKGISAIENIIITDVDGNVLGDADMKNKNDALVRLKSELYIAQNSSRIIEIKATTRQEDYITYEQLSIESAQDISTDAYIESSFPLIGDRFKTISGGSFIGHLEVGTVIVSNGLRTVHIGETNRLITQFTFKETTGNEDIYIKRIKLNNAGSSYVKLANVDLVDQNNKVIATVVKPDGPDIIFDMSKSPYKIQKGFSRTLSVKADIASGSGGYIKFEIENENDILVFGKEYLFDLQISGKDGDSFPIGRGKGSYVNVIKINDVEISIYKNNSSNVGGLVAGAKKQSLGLFNVRSNGSTIDLQAVSLEIINGGDINLNGDILIRDHKTKKILGQIESNSANGKEATIRLNYYPEIKSKKVYTFEVLADINNKATILDTYQVKITGINFQMPNSDRKHYLNNEIYGNVLSVKRSNLTIKENGSLSDKKVAAGKVNVLIGSFTMQAGIAEDLTIESFNISETPEYQMISYSKGYSNLKIKINKKSYATYQAPNEGSFIVDKPFTIKAGKTVKISVYVDTTPLVDNHKIKLSINNVNAYGKVSELEPTKTGENSQSFETKFKQNRLVIDKNTEMEDTVIQAGTSNQKIASFTFENTGVESIKITNFTLAETEDSNEISYNNGYSNIRASNGKNIKKPIAGGNKFGGFTVKAGETRILNIYINTDETTAGDEFNLVFKDIQISGGVVVDGHYVIGQSVRVVGN
jgi:uncharacterized protein YcfL